MFAPQPTRQLTLLDATSLVVGIIIGAGIYQMAPDIAKGVGGPGTLLGLWLVGGVLSLAGAVCYAELASAYPCAGGDYVYLGKAYGPWAGFLFGWAQLTIVRPGDIAVMAFIFGTYAQALADPLSAGHWLDSRQLYALGAVVLLTLVNVAGVRQGKWTQNLLTLAKVVGLLVIAGVAAFGVAAPRPQPEASASVPPGLALVFVLFTYGGWNEMAYVAAEVKNPRRNIARALVLGTGSVTLLYLLVNAAFLKALGFEGLRNATAVGAAAVAAVLPGAGVALMAGLICVSALGATNGLIFAGARISYALGREHLWFRGLGRWDAIRGTPAIALLLQGGIAGTLILLLGHAVNAILYTAAVVYSFYAATALAVLVLRRKEPRVERPFRVPGFPWTPLLFAAVCLFLIRSAVSYRPGVALAAVALLLAGVLVWRLQPRQG